MGREVVTQMGVMLVACLVGCGVLPGGWERYVAMVTMHVICHMMVILPLTLATVQEKEE